MTAWLLVGVIVVSTTVGDLLQSAEMKRHGELINLRPGPLGRAFAELARRRNLLLAILCMALSFFAFLRLLQIADLSFAVPATAATYILETVLARLVLRERLDGRRWVGAGFVAAGIALLAA